MNKENKIQFSEVCEKIKEALSEKVFKSSVTNRSYDKYMIHEINETDNTVTVTDRESDYIIAYKLPYVASQIEEGLKVSIDFENKIDMAIGVVEKTDAIFNVKEEIDMIVKDAVDFEVAGCKKVIIKEYQSKVDELSTSLEDFKLENATLKKHLAIFEKEKQEYMEQKHKEVIDTLISSRREEMGKFSDLLEYCLLDNYSKSVETVEKELKEIHYNFMVKNNPGNKKTFSVVETEIINNTEGNTEFERYGDVAKYLKK